MKKDDYLIKACKIRSSCFGLNKRKYANWTPGQEAETLHGRETATSERVSVFRQGKRETESSGKPNVNGVVSSVTHKSQVSAQ